MDILNNILENHILLAAFLGYFSAQVAKAIIEGIMNKTFSFHRLLTGNGGMPSSHSATVCAMATMAGMECGIASPIFAVSVIFAIVVMTDASGVRRETGKQAVIINEMMTHLKSIAASGFKPEFTQERLKEFIGHSPAQVAIGGIMGVVLALIMHYAFWN